MNNIRRHNDCLGVWCVQGYTRFCMALRELSARRIPVDPQLVEKVGAPDSVEYEFRPIRWQHRASGEDGQY